MRLILTLCLYFATINLVDGQAIVPLNNGWTFSEAGKGDTFKAVVPGSVQADLLRLHKIQDPFTGLNEAGIAWIEEKDWMYTRVFNVSSALLQKEGIDLVFEGLDTYAAVYLNGKPVLEAANMFRRWVVDVKRFLKPGENTLAIKFFSVTNTAGPLARASKIKYPADNEQGKLKISPFVRKAPFQFGWDFAPRMLTAGIWKPVYLQIREGAILETVKLDWTKINKEAATCIFNINIKAEKPANYVLEVHNLTTNQVFKRKIGNSQLRDSFTVSRPRLWHPNGSGAQPLYKIKFSLLKDGRLADSKIITTGIRDLQVIHQPDAAGESFYFKVNGRPVFVKGANWVPLSSFTGTEDTLKLRKLFADMKRSNFNMIRVWGGGLYESDAFYSLADSYGIMVWQDFPFACTMYPSDEKFLANVAQEAIDNITRIANHPSLALWCGNNEIAVGWQNWGWQKTYGYSKADSLELIHGYQKLFKELLPALVKEYDPGRFYFHSSPISNWGKPEDFKKGDNHYWGVYHGEEPFAAYETHVPRFNSEFGFQSFPSWQTLQKITGNAHPQLEGKILAARQKSYKGNQLLTKYMHWYYKTPATDEEYVYLSQLQQAEGMKIAIEASRRSMPYNMGTLVWQFNDVWPAISWSAINFDGSWKPAQYFIKKAYAPVIISVKEEKDSLTFYFPSDLDKKINGTLVIESFNFSGKSLFKQKISDVKVLENEVNFVKVPLTGLGITNKQTDFITATFLENGKAVATSIHHFLPVKDLILPKANITHSVVQKKEGIYLLLKSDAYVKNVFLSIQGTNRYHFEDNYFDMLPGKTYLIKIETRLPYAVIRKGIKIKRVT